jgi:hypothetical protein
VSHDAAFYDSALRRLDRFVYIIAIVAVLILGILEGWRGALGCALGAALSALNLRLWKALATSIGGSSKRPRTASAVLLGSRYLLLGAALFAIIKYFGVSLRAVLAGLLVSVAAVIVEIVYELIFVSHKA